MSYEVTLLVFGILLLVLGLVGKIKVKKLEVGTNSIMARVIIFIIGLTLTTLSFQNVPMSMKREKATKESKQIVQDKRDVFKNTEIATEEKTKSTNDIDEYIERMEKSNMIFNPPDKLSIGSTHQMKLIIDYSKSFKELKNSFNKGVKLSERNLSVSKQIEVELTGKAFKIKATTPKRQAMAKKISNIWTWEITPIQIGEHKLQLAVFAIFDEYPPKTIQVFYETIKVHNLSITEQIVNFFQKEYKWILTTLLTPMFLYFLNIFLKYIKSRKEKKKTKKYKYYNRYFSNKKEK